MPEQAPVEPVATDLGQYSFEDSIFSYSRMWADGDYLYVYGGGHSATPLANIVRYHIPTGVWERCYEPVPLAKMREWVVVQEPIPDHTWTDVNGECTLGGSNADATGLPAGTIYKSPNIHPVSKFWDVQGYTSGPFSQHTYHRFLKSSRTGKFYLTAGNNGNNLTKPVGSIAINGGRCAYDPVSKTWEYLGPALSGNAAAVEPNLDYFVLLNSSGSLSIYDPVTNALVKPAVNCRSQAYFTTPYANPFEIDEALVWHQPLGCFVYLNRQSPQRIFLLRLDANLSPMFTELPQTVAEGVPVPTTSNMDSRKWAALPDGRLVGGLRGGYMWIATVTENGVHWDRKLAAGSRFASCFANETIGYTQYYVAYPTSGKMRLYKMQWGAVVAPPKVPTITANVTPEFLQYGGGLVTLNAVVTDTTEVRVDGSVVTLPLEGLVNSSKDFVFEAIGPGGSATDTVSVTVETVYEAVDRLKIELSAEKAADLADDAAYELLIDTLEGSVASRDAMIDAQAAEIVEQAETIEFLESEVFRLTPDTTPPTTSLYITRADNYDTSAVVTWDSTDNKDPSLEFQLFVDGIEVPEPFSGMVFANLSLGEHEIKLYTKDDSGNFDLDIGTFLVEEEPVEEPPPGPVVITSAIQVWDGLTGMTKAYFNKGADILWRNRPGGDWLDANQLPQGPTPFVQLRTTGTVAPYWHEGDITTLVNRLAVANSGFFMKVTGTTKMYTRTGEFPPQVVFTKDGVDTVIPLSALQAQSGSGSPVVSPLISIDSTRHSIGQFPILPYDTVKLRIAATGKVTMSIFEIHQPKVYDFKGTPEYGIAKNYQGDVGLKKHPDVYFTDVNADNHAENQAEIDWRKTLWNPGGRNTATLEATGGPDGGPCLKGTIPQGSSGSDISRMAEWSRNFHTNAGRVIGRFNVWNGLRTKLDHDSAYRLTDPSHADAPEELYFRYYIKNAVNRMNCAIEGDKLPGICGPYGDWNGTGYYGNSDGNGGASTNGRRNRFGFLSGWTMRLHMQKRPSDGNPFGEQLKRGLGVYAYHCHQPTEWGDTWYWGNDDPNIGRVLVDPDKWYCIEQRVKLNTIRGLTAEEQAERIATVQAGIDADYNRQKTRLDIRLASRAVLLDPNATVEQKNAEILKYYDNLVPVEQAITYLDGRIAYYEADIVTILAIPLPQYNAQGYDQWGNGEGNFDGIVETWIDGFKVLSRTNVKMRRHPWIRIDRIWIDHLHGGNYKAEHNHNFWEACLVVARKYIGPLFKG